MVANLMSSISMYTRHVYDVVVRSAGIPVVVLIGEDELAQGTVTVKGMASETQTSVARQDVVAEVRKYLSGHADD